jgi:hypothetical protein
MRREPQQVVLESVFVEMDPILHGFAGVLVELCWVGGGYAVLETAVGSGALLLDFFSESEALARALFLAELRGAGAAAIP